MHILVTGASGFIGQAFVRMALSHGHRVTAMCRDAATVPVQAAPLVHALGSDEPLVLPVGLDAVIHLAQSRAYRTFPADAEEMFRVNVLGTQSLLQAAAAAKVQHFSLVSSGTVYEPFDGILDEARALSPSSYLGASKLASEVIAKPFASIMGLATLRLFAPYGPGQTERLIPDLIRRVRNGVPVTLPMTGGGMSFSPTYVDDICDVMLAAAVEAWSGTFNVAASHVLTMQDVATEIGLQIGRAPVFERKAQNSPAIVPNLDCLAARYALPKFRSFASGIKPTILASG